MADPASIRYWNPGAMWPGPSSDLFGSKEAIKLRDGNKIAVFPDAESGAAAQFDLLGRKYSGMRLADAIAKWSGGNHSLPYTRHVAVNTGLTPETVLTPELLRDPTKAVPIARAMAAWEAGRRDPSGRLSPYPISDEQWTKAHGMYLGAVPGKPSPAPYDMYGETVTPASASPPTRPPSAPPPAAPMATYDGDTPEQVAYSRKLAQQLTGQAMEGKPRHWLEALGNLSLGASGSLWSDRARTSEMAGKTAAGDALRYALTAPNPTAAIGAAMAPGANPYVSEALAPLAGSVINRRIAEDSPAARIAREKAEFELGEEKFGAPLRRRGLEADVKAKEQKDAIDEWIGGMFAPGGAAKPPPAAPAPTPSVGPPAAGARPMSGEMAPPGPPGGIIKVADGPSAPAPPAAAPAAPKTLKDIIASRPLAEQQMFGFLYKTDKKKAAELLQTWTEPKISGGSQHDLEKSLSGLVTMRAGLNEVSSQFKPEYMNMYPRLGMAFNSWKAKIAGGQSLTSDEQSQLANFEKFRSTSFGVLNTRLKEMAGTAVTESEMKRILREVPNPGTGVMDGDDPITFKAKMDQTIRMANLGIARMYYLRKNGFGGDVNEAEKSMPLDSVPKRMDELGAEKFRRLKSENPAVPDEKLFEIAKRETAKEFGLDI